MKNKSSALRAASTDPLVGRARHPTARQDNLAKTTYCTGLWLLDENSKHPSEHYENLIRPTCRLIAGGRLVLFHDDPRVGRLFENAARLSNIELTTVTMPLRELPTATVSERMLAACTRMDVSTYPRRERQREKGVLHFSRDYLRSGERAYRDLATIWTSKISLVADVAIPNVGSDTQFVAWIDASIARFQGLRQHWDFVTVPQRHDVMQHYANNMRYLGERLPINASYLMADRSLWPIVDQLFYERLHDALEQDYAHDEETILGLVHHDRPELFTRIGRNYGRLRRRFRRVCWP